MTRTFAAAIFAAFLAVTIPARAATIVATVGNPVEGLNLNFGNGYQFEGDITFALGVNDPFYDGVDNAYGGTVYFDGAPLPLQPSGVPPVPYADVNFAGPYPPGVEYILAYSYIPKHSPYYLPSVFADFTLNGTEAISGSVSCVSGCAVTPLPPTLPLFGTALAGLGGFGWLKRRGKVSRTGRG